MKRRVWAAASAVMMATTAFGAQAVLADKYPNGQVKVFNWGEYIDEDLIDEFEDEYGIEVIYDTFDTNEAMYPRVEADPSLYDVICPSDYMIEKMIQNDVLQEIDWDQITNKENIGEVYLRAAKALIQAINIVFHIHSEQSAFFIIRNYIFKVFVLFLAVQIFT